MDLNEYKKLSETLQKSLLAINEISTAPYKIMADTISQTLNDAWRPTIQPISEMLQTMTSHMQQAVRVDQNIANMLSDLAKEFSSTRIKWDLFANVKTDGDYVELSNEAYNEMSQTIEPSPSDANIIKVEETDSRRVPTYLFIQWLFTILLPLLSMIQTQILSVANTDLLEKHHQEDMIVQKQSISLQREELEALEHIEELLAILVDQEDTPTGFDGLPEFPIDIPESPVDSKSDPVAPNQSCSDAQSLSTEYTVQTEEQPLLK